MGHTYVQVACIASIRSFLFFPSWACTFRSAKQFLRFREPSMATPEKSSLVPRRLGTRLIMGSLGTWLDWPQPIVWPFTLRVHGALLVTSLGIIWYGVCCTDQQGDRSFSGARCGSSCGLIWSVSCLSGACNWGNLHQVSMPSRLVTWDLWRQGCYYCMIRPSYASTIVHQASYTEVNCTYFIAGG